MLEHSVRQTITVWNVVVPAAVWMAVERLDSQSIREPMSYQTGDGHTTTGLVQTRHRILYQRRRTTATA